MVCMISMVSRWSKLAGCTLLILASAHGSMAAPPPSVRDVLSIRPRQTNVQYDIPDPSRYGQLSVESVRTARATGWVLKDAAGSILRQFLDTNRDDLVDIWSFYSQGTEVYRDVDSDFNGRPDLYRWMNEAGSRIGKDSNEDGIIDRYVRLSVEEATSEVIRAIAAGQFSLLEPLIVGREDLPYLGSLISEQDLEQARSKARIEFQSVLLDAKHFSAQTRWVRFDGSLPRAIPVEDGTTEHDVVVYPNGLAVAQTGDRLDLLQFGDLIRVGDTWKILAVPTVASADGRAITAPQSITSRGTTAASPSATEAPDKLQTLIVQLQELDRQSSDAGSSPESAASYQIRRSDLLEQLIEQADSSADKAEWHRQLVDGLLSSIQATNNNKQIRDRLARILRSVESDKQAASYIIYRQLSADYALRMQDPKVDFSAEQTRWLDELKQFVQDYPAQEDTPDALAQLASGKEFMGEIAEAKQYYEKLRDGFPSSTAARRAVGALRRLDLQGKPLELSGRDLRNSAVTAESYKGRVLLVTYWATWCGPCKAEMPELKKIYEKYHKKGFEIVTVNIDEDRSAAAQYAQSQKLPWPVMFAPGGMDSPLAAYYGIISLPAHFLVDQKGKVISTDIQISQLESELSKVLR